MLFLPAANCLAMRSHQDSWKIEIKLIQDDKQCEGELSCLVLSYSHSFKTLVQFSSGSNLFHLSLRALSSKVLVGTSR